jgi:hypothetical protein
MTASESSERENMAPILAGRGACSETKKLAACQKFSWCFSIITAIIFVSHHAASYLLKTKRRQNAIRRNMPPLSRKQ